MIKHISILLICLMLALSISFVIPILPVVRAEPNSDPINSNPYPSNGATDITLVPISLSITVNDIDNIPAVNEYKAVDGYSGTYTDWTENGIVPYLSASDDSNNIFESTTDLSKEGWFTFADTTNTGSGYSVTMYIEFDSSGDEVCNWYIDTTGDNTPEFQGTIVNGGSAGLKNTGVISGLDTAVEINAARVYFEYDSYWSSDDMQIDYVYLNITRAEIYNDIEVIFRTNESGVWHDAGVENGVGNGTYYCFNTSWVDSFSTRYWWSVNTTDGVGWDNNTYYFTTKVNSDPVNSNPFPVSGAIDVGLGLIGSDPRFGISVFDADDLVQNMDIVWFTNESGVWKTMGTNISVSNGVYYCDNVSWVNSFSTRYWWSVNTTDGVGWDNNTYYFTTISEYMPDAPFNFTALAENRTKITLTWVGDSKADSTRIEWSSYEDFIWDIGNHDLLYNGSEETAAHTDLGFGETVYYKAWSYNKTSNLWSSGTTTNGTTKSNSVPIVSLVNPYPNGTTGVELSPILNVSISDIDFDNVDVTFYNFSDDSVIGTDIIIGGSGYAAMVWSGLDNTTEYKWYVKVDDSYDNITEPEGTGSYWSFTTGPIANNPPFIPSDPDPVNHATSVNINVNLSWLGGDPDCGDIVTYDIYFGTNNNPPLYESNYSTTSYNPGNINSNTKYYWKIISIDNYGANTSGPIWDFTTIYVNQPPNIPSNPTPGDGKKSINIDQDLSWMGGDPDAGDTVTYDVYFGSMLPLEKVASNISTPTYNPGILTNGLTYFWKIISWDNHGLSTIGPQWYFTTINATNKPPNKPNKPSGITSGKIGTTHSYTTSTTDPNDDYVYYWFDWGDGTNSGWDGPYYSGDNVTLAHAWIGKGTYPIKVKAKDINDNESVWSDPLVISMPKIKIYNQIEEILYRIFARFPFLEKIILHLPFFEKLFDFYIY